MSQIFRLPDVGEGLTEAEIETLLRETAQQAPKKE